MPDGRDYLLAHGWHEPRPGRWTHSSLAPGSSLTFSLALRKARRQEARERLNEGAYWTGYGVLRLRKKDDPS
jgi:hypothetical protein